MSQSLLMRELSYPQSMPIPDLSVVMPCFNEQGQIEALLKDWSQTFDAEKLSYEIIVINDGSLDGTSRVLDRLRKEIKGLRIVHQLNSGHGKAVLRGYELSRAEWVLQLDSNGRFEPSDFELFWRGRVDYDLIVANRTHRLDPLLRRLSVEMLGQFIHSLFKVDIGDPDVSFRLFRRVPVLDKVKLIPKALLGVNLAMTILLKLSSPERVLDVRVPYRVRSLHKGRMGVFECVKIFFGEISELVKLRFSIKNTVSDQ